MDSKLKEKLIWLDNRAKDVESLMEVGGYFDLDELVEEINLIGISIEEEVSKFLIPNKDKILEIADELKKVNKETPNKTVFNLTNDLKKNVLINQDLKITSLLNDLMLDKI